MLSILTWTTFLTGVLLAVLNQVYPVLEDKKLAFVFYDVALLGIAVLGFGLHEIASAIRRGR